MFSGRRLPGRPNAGEAIVADRDPALIPRREAEQALKQQARRDFDTRLLALP
jgi:hypothetical protein